MAYCSRCGVEVEQERTECPLCDTPIHRYDEEESCSSLWPIAYEQPQLRRRTKRFVSVLPLLLIFVIAFVILFTVDMRMNGVITWSKYSLSAVGSIIISIIGVVLFVETKIVTVGWITLSTIGMLYLLDSFNDASKWLMSMGIPLTILVAVYVEFSIIAFTQWKKKFSAFFTSQTALVTLLCFGIDYVISDANGAQPLTWSLIVAVPLLILGGFTLFSTKVLSQFFDIGKYLHR